MQIQAIVVAWQVYDITRDPLTLGYVGLAQFLPMVVLLLPAGDLVDRFDRKRILQLSWLTQGVCSACLIALSLQRPESALPFYAVLVLFGAARAFTGPTLQSLLPQIVPRAQLGKAIALNSSIMKIGVIGGPLLGGLLYTFGAALTTAWCWRVSWSPCSACSGCRCATPWNASRGMTPLGSASPPAFAISAVSR